MPTLKQNINKPERLKEQVAREAFRFVENKKTISYLDTENKKIRPTLEKYVADKGSVDSNGSSAAVIEYADKLVVLKQTCRNRASVLPNALEELKKRDSLNVSKRLILLGKILLLNFMLPERSTSVL